MPTSNASKRRLNPADGQRPSGGLTPSVRRVRQGLALAWLVGFLLFFYSFTLPNNPDWGRQDVWREVPFRLLDLIDPVPVEGGPPSGWAHFPQRFDLMLVAAVIYAGAWGLGHLLLRAVLGPFDARSNAAAGRRLSPPLHGGAGRGKAEAPARPNPPGPPLVRGGEEKAVRGGEATAVRGREETGMRGGELTALERTVFAFALGLSGLSLVTLGCGLAGGLSQWLLGGAIVLCVVLEAGLRWFAHSASGGRQPPGSGEREPGKSRTERKTSRLTPTAGREVSGESLRRWLCLAATVPFLVLMFLGAMSPPTDFDVREYHLQGPKEFYENGRIAFLPHNVYTSFPFLTPMLSLLAMVLRDDWFSGALAGKLVLMGFAPLTALALYAAGRRWFSPAVGWLAATIHLTTPWTYRISIIAYAEGGLTFYLVTSLLAAMIAIGRFRTEAAARSFSPPLQGEAARHSPPLQGGAGGGKADARARSTLPGPPLVRGGEEITGGEPTCRAMPLRLVLLAGLLAGSAMACKYPALLSVVLPLGVALLLGTRSQKSAVSGQRSGSREQEAGGSKEQTAPEQACLFATPDDHTAQEPPSGQETDQGADAPRSLVVRVALLYSLGVLLAVGPWLLKNAVETGNPVYPLAYSVFGGREWDAEMNEKWRAAHSPDTYAPGDLAVKLIDVTAKSDWLSPLLFGLAPLVFLLADRRSLVRFSAFAAGYVLLAVIAWLTLAERMGGPWVVLPVLIGLLPLVWLAFDGRPVSRWLWLYAGWLFLAWWLFTHRIDRFWVPMIPVGALLAGAGAAFSPQRVWQYACAGLMAAAILFNLGYITMQRLVGPNVMLTDLTAARELMAKRGIQFLNERLPPGSKVLFVGEAEVFDARFPHVYHTVFDDSIFEEWTSARLPGVPPARQPLRDRNEIRARLRREGITHVSVNWQEVLRYRLTYGYAEFVFPARFTELQRQGILGPPVVPRHNDWQALAPLTDRDRRELETWAPELLTTVNGHPAWITAQLFPVE